jgi:hypothetical protein
VRLPSRNFMFKINSLASPTEVMQKLLLKVWYFCYFLLMWTNWLKYLCIQKVLEKHSSVDIDFEALNREVFMICDIKLHYLCT